MLFYVLLAVVAVLFYVTCVRPLRYWKKRGVLYVEPLPLFGNILDVVIRKKSFFELINDIYKHGKNKRYIGFYQLLQNMLIIRDPELIKQICVKDFDTFAEHSQFIPDDVDQLWSKNLFAMKADKWRDMRPTLSPAFTSSKMKMMFNLIQECAQQFTQYFLQQEKDVLEMDLGDTFPRFANDVIATTSFGLECNSLEKRDNEFYKMGKEISNFDGIKGLFFFLYNISPRLSKLLKLRLFSKKATDYFESVINETKKEREKLGIVRPDMLNLLIQAQKNGFKHEEEHNVAETGFATVKESELGVKTKKNEITDEDIAAQAMIFFFAGFDTVSRAMCFTAHELAVNPDVQEKLYEEINTAWEECNGNVGYEIVMKMKYLDMVVSEALRKWPPVGMLDRLALKSYTIEPVLPGEKPLVLDRGTIYIIPQLSIHRDPQYFPDPEKFIPERFSEENKKNINPMTYMPFGIGPRNCIGSRFALLEIKIILVHVLKHFELVPTKKTRIPIVLNKSSVNFKPEGGFWLGFKRRNNNIL